MMLRWLLPSVAGLFLLAGPVRACPFCNPSGQTLSAEVAQADFILYGTLSNPQRDPNDLTAFNKGHTDLTIELVIKPHDTIKGKKTITIPRYIQTDGKNTKYLIFFNIFNDKLEPYRGELVSADSKLPEYLKGAIAVRQKDTASRLRYFFNYLEDPEITISTDAYAEFGYADYKEVRSVAPSLPAETILRWLRDSNTRGSRFGLYGLLLGHCGKPTDAKAMRELLDDPSRSFTSGLDGVVTGYTLLDPKAGWDYVLQLISTPNAEFGVRYGALKTIRFFWEDRPDVIPHERVLEAMKVLCNAPDIADMPIDDLRKWKVWELAPFVLAFADRDTHKSIPIVKRAILKFAIAASWADPKNSAAVDYVRAARATDAKKVEFLEEILKDEAKPMSAPKDTPKAGG